MLEPIYVWLGLVRVRVRAPCLVDEQQTERQAERRAERSRWYGEPPGEQQAQQQQQQQQREDTRSTTRHANGAQQGTPEAPPGSASQSDSAGQAQDLPASTASIPQIRRSKRSIDDISDSEGSGSARRIRPDASVPRSSNLRNRHDLGCHLPWLVGLGLAAWEEAQSGKENSRDGAGPTSPHGASQFELPHRPPKRLRSSRSSGPQSPTGSSPAGERECSIEEGSRLLACPFYRHDPARHHGCVGDPTLGDADAVRYHVLARHRNPLRCPICYVEFERHADRDRHVVSRACKPPPEPPADLQVGVSASQAAELAVQGGRGAGVRMDPATSWDNIWDVLFPGQEKPADSQFVAEGIETNAARLRIFWSAKGRGLVTSALEGKGALEVVGLRLDTPLEALFASVLDGMLASLQQKEQGGE
ncbi:hypothetical protein RB601_004229 [Gaeumannomyces tritici]